MLFDTHCHLTHPPLGMQLTDVLAAATVAEVTHFLVPGTAPDDWPSIIRLAQQYPMVYPALGLHPWYVDHHHLTDILPLLAAQLLAHPKMVVGEIGLDFARAQSLATRRQQTTAFEAQLDLAKQYHRPVVIHTVHASSACLHSIKRCAFRCGGFAHAFSGSVEEARQWLRHGFKIGIGSLLLRPQAHKIRRLAATLPLSALVLETDAPYLPPNPPAPNLPSNTRKVADALALLQETTWQTVATITTQNALHLLNINNEHLEHIDNN